MPCVTRRAGCTCCPVVAVAHPVTSTILHRPARTHVVRSAASALHARQAAPSTLAVRFARTMLWLSLTLCAPAGGPAADARVRPRRTQRRLAHGHASRDGPGAGSGRCTARRSCRSTRAAPSAGAARSPTTRGSPPSRRAPTATRATRSSAGTRGAGGSVVVGVGSARAPDAEWYGAPPRLIRDLRGADAASRDRQAAAGRRRRTPTRTTYRVWPGPTATRSSPTSAARFPELRLPCRRRRSARTTFRSREIVGSSPSHTGVAAVAVWSRRRHREPGTKGSRSTCWAWSRASTSAIPRSSCPGIGRVPGDG